MFYCKNWLQVADFGLAKLVERSGDDDFIATRLVGTPGYLPPEYELNHSVIVVVRLRL